MGIWQYMGNIKGAKRAPYATKKIETVTINFRVPKSVSEDCKDFVRPLLKEYLKTLNK